MSPKVEKRPINQKRNSVAIKTMQGKTENLKHRRMKSLKSLRKVYTVSKNKRYIIKKILSNNTITGTLSQ